jgi:hypothetical protein
MTDTDTALDIFLSITSVFTALCLACAVVIARRRDTGVGLLARHKRPDPFAQPFGEMPGFARAQLDRKRRRSIRYSSGRTPVNLET